MVSFKIDSLPRVMFAHECTVQDIKVSPVRNTYYELTFIEDGELEIKSEELGIHIMAKPGDFFFAPAGFSYTVSIKSDLKHSCVAFMADWQVTRADGEVQFERFDNKIYTYIEKLHIPITGSFDGRSRDLMHKVINEVKRQSREYSNLRCASSIIELLISIAKLKPVSTNSTGNLYYCKKIKKFLASNFSDPTLDMTAVATYMGLHPNYISGIYKNTVGSTIMADLKAMRISEAKKLLELNKYFVKDVARMVGFSDVNYFSVVFKREVGVSPEQYDKHSTLE